LSLPSWFLKLVDILLRISESFFSISIRSVLILPVYRDIPDKAIFATFPKVIGKAVLSEPRCGVPKNIIPSVEVRISSNRCPSITAVIIAYEYHHIVSKRKIFYNLPTPSEPLSTRSELNYYQTLDRKQLSQQSKLFAIE
jgi:hypothetical protein